MAIKIFGQAKAERDVYLKLEQIGKTVALLVVSEDGTRIPDALMLKFHEDGRIIRPLCFDTADNTPFKTTSDGQVIVE